jgi:hypothetical protein
VVGQSVSQIKILISKNQTFILSQFQYQFKAVKFIPKMKMKNSPVNSIDYSVRGSPFGLETLSVRVTVSVLSTKQRKNLLVEWLL